MKEEATFIKVMNEISKLQEKRIKEAEKVIEEARIKVTKAKKEVERKINKQKEESKMDKNIVEESPEKIIKTLKAILKENEDLKLKIAFIQHERECDRKKAVEYDKLISTMANNPPFAVYEKLKEVQDVVRYQNCKIREPEKENELLKKIKEE